MTTLKKNVSIYTPECSVENKSTIDDRMEQPVTLGDIGAIRASILDLHAVVTASPNNKIQTIKKATSFPVADILAMLNNSPGCQYLRVYNGFDRTTGVFITYMAPISSAFETFLEEDLSDPSIISQSCCHCNPCETDGILNQH
jgi:hypothetical protein